MSCRLSISFTLEHPPTSAPIPSENRSMRFPVRVVVATDRQAARYQQIGFGSSDWLNRREEAANSPGRGLTQLKLSLSLCRLSNKNDHQSKFPLNDLWVALHFFFFSGLGWKPFGPTLNLIWQPHSGASWHIIIIGTIRCISLAPDNVIWGDHFSRICFGSSTNFVELSANWSRSAKSITLLLILIIKLNSIRARLHIWDVYVYVNERGITATKGAVGLKVLTYTWSIQFFLQRIRENSDIFQLDPDKLCCPQLSIEYNDEYSKLD